MQKESESNLKQTRQPAGNQGHLHSRNAGEVFVDNRPEAILQRKLQQIAHSQLIQQQKESEEGFEFRSKEDSLNGQFSGSSSQPIQLVGEKKMDFGMVAPGSNEDIKTGQALLSEAIIDMKAAQRESKEKLWKEEIEPASKSKKPPKGGFTKVYAEGLNAFDKIDFLYAHKHFRSGDLSFDDYEDYPTEVIYRKGKGGPITIANFSARKFVKKVDQPEDANREVLENPVSGKEYVKDDREVETRRYAYVEKNYWQFMEFLTKNKLEGRYQTFFRAANPDMDRPDIREVRASKSKEIRKNVRHASKLSQTQLAVLHQWKGSGVQQRGISLTSTPKIGRVISNEGGNFRTETGVRIKVDLAKIPKDKNAPAFLNHYAFGGVKDKMDDVTIKPGNKDRIYPYVNSVLKNRELFLEFLDPNWIDSIEYHQEGGKSKEIVRGLEDESVTEDLMTSAKEASGYEDFAEGFADKLAQKIKAAKKENADYKAGIDFAEEYDTGYRLGNKNKMKTKSKGTVNPFSIQNIKFNPGGENPEKDVRAIGRIHGRTGRKKATTLMELWA